MDEDKRRKPKCEGGCGSYRLERWWFGDMLVCERCNQVAHPDVRKVAAQMDIPKEIVDASRHCS